MGENQEELFGETGPQSVEHRAPRKEPHFNGPVYDAEKDHARLAGQIKRIRDLMLDGVWRTVPEIGRLLPNDPETSISAQLRHLRKERFGSYQVDKQRRGGETSALWEFRVQEGESHGT